MCTAVVCFKWQCLHFLCSNTSLFLDVSVVRERPVLIILILQLIVWTYKTYIMIHYPLLLVLAAECHLQGATLIFRML